MKNEVTTNNDYTESLFESIKHINDFGQELKKKAPKSLDFEALCGWQESNLHGFPLDPKSSASASSAISA